MKKNIYNLFIISLITFDMGGELGIRLIAFILMLIGFLHAIYRNKALIIPRDMAGELFFLMFLFILWPLVLLIKAQVHGYDLSLSISQVSSLVFAYFYLLYRVQCHKENGVANILNSFYMLSCFYLFMIAIYFLNANVFNSIARFFMERGLYAGVRHDVVDLPNIYIKSSLFIFFAFSCYIGKNRLRSSVIYLGSLITTSKMLFVFNTALAFYRMNFKLKLFVIVMLILLLFLVPSPLLLDKFKFGGYILTAIDSNSVTASKRISDFYSALHLFSNNYIELLFGFGPGSLIFTEFANATVTNIELDHINTIRKFGLLWFMFLCSYVFYVVILLKRNKMSGELIGLAGVFILAGTNPVLISPMFFIILSECRVSVLK